VIFFFSETIESFEKKLDVKILVWLYKVYASCDDQKSKMATSADSMAIGKC
jgi:hypothetical protein